MAKREDGGDEPIQDTIYMEMSQWNSLYRYLKKKKSFFFFFQKGGTGRFK
jgi:hypothetical protein